MPHNHIRVPGFGCTYVKELLQSVGEGSTFFLQFVKKDDYRSFTSLGPTLLFPLEAGRGEVRVGKSSSVLDFSSYQFIPVSLQYH